MVTQILQQIIKQKISDGTTSWWPSYDYLGNKYYGFDLYSGNSGILYSLIHNYNISKDVTIKKTIIESADWLSDNYDFSLPPLFLTGELGIAICFDYLSRHSKQTRHTNFKKKLIDNSVDRLLSNEKIYPSEYLNGLSGSLLALSILRESFSRKRFNEISEAIISKLLKNCFITKDGTQWDYSMDNLAPLCGLSHGKAGIGYVLTSFGLVNKNNFIYNLGLETLNSERKEVGLNNIFWPDYRRGLKEKSEIIKYVNLFKNNPSALTFSDFMNAWCHGALGIGFTRLSLCESVKDAGIDATIDLAVEYVKGDLQNIDEFKNLTLCHGLGGHLLFLKKAQAQRKQADFSYLINKSRKHIGHQLKLKNYKISGLPLVKEQDLSFFNGLSGIMYSLSKTYIKNSFDKFDLFLPELEPPIKLNDREYNPPQILTDSAKLLNRTKLYHEIIYNLTSEDIFKFFVSRVQSIHDLKFLDENASNSKEAIWVTLNNNRVKHLKGGYYFIDNQNFNLLIKRVNASEKRLLSFLKNGKSYLEAIKFIQENIESSINNEKDASQISQIILKKYISKGFFKLEGCG